MIIRPLRDIFPKISLLNDLIPLRKELWIFSASIVVSSWLIAYLDPNFYFLSTYFSKAFWNFEYWWFWAHIGELTWLILLLTSNSFSQKILWHYWKMIQRLSYIYAFSWFYYIWSQFDNKLWLTWICLIFTFTTIAYIKNKLH